MPEKAKPWVIRPLVPEEIYTDRAEFLDYFYQAALKAATRRTMSTVLLGRRRMGKTEIFKRVVNRLFFEQDPTEPTATESLVVPVYYSFPETADDRWEFSKKYLENFLRYYIGFYTRQPELIREGTRGDQLLAKVEEARSLYPFTERLNWVLRLYDAILRRDVATPEQESLEMLRRVSDNDESTIVVFLDEFQNTRLPQDNFNIVAWVKEAVESPTCPHFVTGSAMSILAREILGRGSLFGRFRSMPIKPLSGYWGAELALKAADYHHAILPRLMAPVLAERCGGNPFYINAVIQQSVESDLPLVDEEAIGNNLAVDIASGFIWAELYEQVTSWIERINEYGITKWILYLSVLEEGERISLERIQEELLAREGQHVSLDTIRDVLVRLSRGDLLEYLEMGGWFRKIDDPILLEFLRVWGRVDVEGQSQERVRNVLVQQYRRLERRYHEYKGYLAEVFMGQILLNSHQHRTYPGHFFNSKEDIPMPWPVIFVSHRVDLGLGKGKEIDILASVGGDMWVCQSKWVTTRKVNEDPLRELLVQADAVRADNEVPIPELRMWIFAHEGLTQKAQRLARKEGILWSTRSQLDELLAYLGLRQLPDLEMDSEA